jgi:radical SAM-linked protein
MTAPATIDQEREPDLAPTRTAMRVRLRFAKRGDLRLVSHHDLMRCLERMLRRAELPIAHSQGFNPRPKATFALAMALGIEGRNEVLDLDLTEPLDAAEVLARLRDEAPPGFDFLAAEALGPGRAARVAAALYRLAIPEDRRDEARAAVADLLSRDARPYTRHRPDRTVEIDLRPFVLEAAVADGGDLILRMKITPEGSARPEEVIDALGLKDLLSRGSVLIRDDVELARTD